jgi:hypothetical protein
MGAKKKAPVTDGERDRILGELRRDVAQQQRGYRERALRMFPHICASCGREFSGRRLKELTVHHKNHDHDYNPPDGSNWELLCLYCHDNEHEKRMTARYRGGSAPDVKEPDAPLASPFENLDAMLGAPPPPADEG